MLPSTKRLAIIAAALLLGGGCAALRAPVAFDAPAEEQAPEETALSIEAVEGRPQGLVLRLSCDCELPDDGWLELMRGQQDGKVEVFRRVRLRGRLRAAVRGDGIEFMDRAVEAGQRVGYRLRLRSADADESSAILATSSPLWMTWHKPPPKPEEVRADSRIAGSVELAWAPVHLDGALVFRRDVLDPNAGTERISRPDAGARGLFIDRDLDPGGVYAYRVALFLDRAGLIQYGPPSEEIYVTVAATPATRDTDAP